MTVQMSRDYEISVTELCFESENHRTFHTSGSGGKYFIHNARYIPDASTQKDKNYFLQELLRQNHC